MPLQADPQGLMDLGEVGGPMDPRDQPGTASAENRDNPANLPAGFTFLGQFLDHDITFDPTSSLERQVDPEAISNFRTPSFELDNIYGAGPGANPHLYQRRARGGNPNKFLVGLDTAGQPNDLPRNQDDTALIGDPRNDENLIVSQLHLALLKFHNKKVDDVAARPTPGRSVFDEAQRLVRWHYQWVIVHEFLPHIVGQEAVAAALQGPRFYKPRNEPFIPVEFSVAAYRFGHSQVRPGYAISDQFFGPIFAGLPTQPPTEPNDLSGGRKLLPKQVIQWKRFVDMGDASALQISKRIDTKISSALLNLPFAQGTPDDPKSLAQRNLLRHLTFGLPSGQDVAAAIDLPQDKILSADHFQDVRRIRGGFDQQTPLWFYILREAEVFGDDGARLGPVGGTIVAEVFVGLLKGDRLSYLRANPKWAPEGGVFGIADLLREAGVVPDQPSPTDPGQPPWR